MEPKKLNFRMSNDKPLSITADSIPTLAPKEKLSAWMEGDTDPYYKIQEIEYPIKANGYNYVESFWDSFIAKLNDQLIPGSKGGHETSWGKRAPTDLLLIGGKMEKKGDGTGKVYLKNYIMPVGESGDNSIFIKENKTGMVDYSLVSYTKDERTETPDGYEWNVVESMYGERNDSVGYGEGAMEQKTNSREADKGEIIVEKKELLQALLTMKNNNAIDLQEIAKHLGLDTLMLTDEQKTNLSAYGKIKTLCGDKDPIEEFTDMKTNRDEVAKQAKANAITEEFGPEVHPITGKANSSREFAIALLGEKGLSKENIAEIEANETFKRLAKEIANKDSDYNTVVGVIDDHKKSNTEESTDGVKVRKI